MKQLLRMILSLSTKSKRQTISLVPSEQWQSYFFEKKIAVIRKELEDNIECPKKMLFRHLL